MYVNSAMNLPNFNVIDWSFIYQLCDKENSYPVTISSVKWRTPYWHIDDHKYTLYSNNFCLEIICSYFGSGIYVTPTKGPVKVTLKSV